LDPQYFLVIAVAVFMSWFAFGILYNLRRGNAMLKWMQGGLPSVGPRTTLRWLGSTVAELVIDPARSPFRRLETLLVLNPRDVPWMWLFAVLKAGETFSSSRAPEQPARVDLELADPVSWTGGPRWTRLRRAAGRANPTAGYR